MFRLDRISKAYEEAGSLSEQVNLFGFIDDQVFLTKSGDVGVVMALSGVDYECLDSTAIDHLTKRLESAFKIFDENCRVFQYLFKRNQERIPYQTYGNPVVGQSHRESDAVSAAKADTLYSLKIYYVILLQNSPRKTGLLATVQKLASEPIAALRELRVYLSTKRQVLL